MAGRKECEHCTLCDPCPGRQLASDEAAASRSKLEGATEDGPLATAASSSSSSDGGTAPKALGSGRQGQLQCGGTVSGDTTSPGSDQVGFPAPDHVFDFQAPFDGVFTFDACNSAFDTLLRVYSQEMGRQLLNCDDCNSCSEFSRTNLTVELMRGAYSLVIEGFREEGGPYSILTSCRERVVDYDVRALSRNVYSQSSAGDGACPDGTNPLESEAECMAASSSFNLLYSLSTDFDDRPAGCTYNINGFSFFNAPSTPPIGVDPAYGVVCAYPTPAPTASPTATPTSLATSSPTPSAAPTPAESPIESPHAASPEPVLGEAPTQVVAPPQVLVDPCTAPCRLSGRAATCLEHLQSISLGDTGSMPAAQLSCSRLVEAVVSQCESCRACDFCKSRRDMVVSGLSERSPPVGAQGPVTGAGPSLPIGILLVSILFVLAFTRRRRRIDAPTARSELESEQLLLVEGPATMDLTSSKGS